MRLDCLQFEGGQLAIAAASTLEIRLIILALTIERLAGLGALVS